MLNIGSLQAIIDSDSEFKLLNGLFWLMFVEISIVTHFIFYSPVRTFFYCKLLWCIQQTQRLESVEFIELLGEQTEE